VGYSVAVSWVFTIIIAAVTPYCVEYIKRWTFFIFFVSTIGSFPFFYFLTPETKDKTIEEIRKDYETKSYKEPALTEVELASKREPSTERNIANVFVHT
jgi:hypothetical protein